uniref:MBG domain-containing protein n=1 Tax=Gemmiger formicilis TaxID=745368 RepID=UPI003FEF83E5
MKKRVLSLFLAITLCLTLTPTGALAEESLPGQTVVATQETETPTPAPQKEESTAPAENGADENASPASPDEKPTENTPAAPEKNPADEEPGKEPAAATRRDESKADGSPSDDDAAKVQNQLVMAAAAVQNEPTMEGKNELPALNNAGQDAAEGENGEAGDTSISEEDTRTEISCTMKPSSIQRGYDGTTDGSTISIDLTFTDDGTNEIKLKEGTGFTAKKTFDSADAGWHTVTVEIELIGDAAEKYKLRAGEEKFTIDGYINKAYPDLTVSLSKTACTVGEKILPLLSVEGAPKDAEVTYYYLASELKSWAGSSDVEGSEAMPKIDENTAIGKPGTYYVYAKTGETKNYEEERSATAELTVNEAVVEAASVTKADGTVSGTYKTLPAALDAAQDGDTVKLLANHTTNWDNVDAGDEQMAVVRKTLTLDLNGMTVDYLVVGEVVPDEAGGILESYDGNLTVVDNIQGGSCGKIKDLEFVKGSLAIQGGRIGDDDGSNLTCDGNSGTVTISGGTVCNVTVGDGAAVTVTGGTGHAGKWYNDGTLNITDGTFGNVKFRNNGGTIAISGGTFGTITNTNGSSSIPLMPLLADNYAFYQSDNAQNSTEKTLTNVTVRPHTHSFENGKCDCGVAAIVVDNNNSFYNTLQAALGAAADDASITSVTLGQDLTEDVMFSGSAAGSLTLNMNGHKLETEAGVPLIVTGGTLRIEGAGEINQNTASNANAFPAIALTGGKLVITGDLTAQGGYDSSSGRKPAIRAEEGELDLQGNVSLNGGLTMLGNAKLTNLLTKGTFYAQDPNGNATADNVLAVFVQQEVASSDNYNTVLKLIADGYAIYKKDGTVKNAATFTLNSDTYSIKSHTCNYTQDETHGIAYCKCGRSHAHRDLSEEKSVLVNGVCPICGYHCPHKNIGDDGVCKDCNAKMVAKVTVGETTTYTADLADALNKAANGTTITLLANTMLPDGIYVSKTLTLDLDGHSLSGYSLNVGGLTATSQVRTGNLTVIDSSGGNGAVGVTVRDGGTLVFDPKNDHTTLLQLEVWGGTVELYGGKILRSGLRLNNGITLGDLLPGQAGLAYYRDDTQLTPEEAASQTCDLVVKSCSHGGKNGFDNNFTACPYCNAPAVAETALNHGEGNRPQRRFADLQTALDADRDGGATLKLLADVTGDYTIDGTQDTGLNLNGHSIKGTVTVKGIKGDYITTTLSNTKNTTTVSIDKVVAHKGAKLAGSGYPAVIGTLTLAEDATWDTILNNTPRDTSLGYKVLNADGTHKWYAQDDVKVSQLNNVIINRLPITSKTLSFKVNGTNVKGNKAERGTTVQLCAYCNAKDADVSIYIGETVGNSLPIYRQKKAEYQKIGTSWYYVVDLDANTIGTYDIYFTASKDGYKVTSAHKKLTVTKPNLSNAEITFPYGNEAAFNYATATGVPTFVVTYKGTELKENVDFVITRGASTYDVGPCTLTIKATDNGDYTGSKSAQWNVRPLKVAASVGDIIKTYDGTTDLPANTKITFKSADSYYPGVPLSLAKGTDYEVSNARYDSADASETEKTVSFTIKLKNKGYVFDDGTTQKDFTLNGAELGNKIQINKATAPMNNPIGTLNIINGTQQTYTYDFNNILPGLPGGKYGTISYGQPAISLVSQSGYYYDQTIVEFKKGVLTLAQFYAKDGKMTGKIGTVKVNVTTTNYADFQLKLVLYAVDQIKPVPDGTITAAEITYGQTLSESRISGTMKDPDTGKSVNGTFAWTDGTINPNAGDYEADWTFTPDAPEYAALTGKTTVKVAPKSIEGAVITLNQTAFQYDTTEKAPTITEVKLANWSDEITYDIVSGDKATNASDSITLTIQGNGNYTGTATAEWKITPKVVTNPSINVAPCTYNGHEQQPPVELKDGDAVVPKDEYTVSYSNNINAGTGTATVTITDKPGGNYTVSGDANFTISKATAPRSDFHPAVTVINDLAKTYEMVLFSDYLPKLSSPCEYGTVSYSLRGTYLTDGYKDTVQAEVVEENSQYKLKLTVPAVDYDKVSSVGTIDVRVTSDNYRDFYLTIGVKTKNKDVPVPDGTISASNITYGQALNDSKIAGKMKAGGKAIDGTFTWTNGTFKPAAGDYPASWTFTPATGYEEYATATGTATVTVDPKAVTVRITPNGGTYGETITPATATANDVVGEDAPEITLTYTGTANDGTEYTGTTPPTKAGTYTVTATTTNPNYTLDPKTTTADFTIAKRPATVTPDNKSKVYEEKDPELTYIVSGVLSGETLKGITLARAEGENAGQYAITATADAGANPNYEVTFAKGTLTIEPKSIKGAKVVLGKGLTANGAEQTQTVEKVLLDDKEIPADSYTVAGNTATAPGRYTLTVTAKGNYTDSVEQIYAIAYKDTAVPSSSKPSSNNSSNDSETKKNEVAAPTPAPTTASTSKPSTITALPQTGDTSNPTLYVVLLVASLLGLAVVFVCKKRNDK